MVVPSTDTGPAPAADTVSYVRDMAAELAVLCVGAGRPDAGIALFRVVLMLQRPLTAQPPDANAAPGDAA